MSLHALKRLPYTWLGLMPLAERVEQFARCGTTRRALDKQTALLPAVQDLLPTDGARVTIVLPTFNRASVLPHALASVVAQTITDWRCLVINDGGVSPDLPDDGRFSLVELPHNIHNLGVLRNLGIAAARSPYVAFFDDDNQWLPHHLQTLLEHMQRCSCRVAYSYLRKVDGRGATVGTVGKPFSRRQLARYNFVDSNAIMLRKESASPVPVMPRRRSSWRKEDWAFVLANSRLGPIHEVPEETVRYLVNPQSYYSKVR